MKPICVRCQRFYRLKKSGYYFTEMMPKPGIDRPPAGTEMPSQWQPYKVWAGDLFECKGCGHQIISGFGVQAITEHYKPEFKTIRAELNAAQFNVNDC